MAEKNLDWLTAHPAVTIPQAQPPAESAPQSILPQHNGSADLGWLNAHPAVDNAGAAPAAALSAGRAGTAEPDIGTGRSLLRGFNDAITLGTSDEILAGLNAAVAPLVGHGDDGATFGERYKKFLAGQRALNASAREQHPVVSGLGSAVGALAPMALTGGGSELLTGARQVQSALSTAGPLTRAAGEASPITQSILKNGAVGGVYGGLYGAGSSDGDMGDRLDAALDGAALGTAVGAAVPAALGGARAAYRAVTSADDSAARQIERAMSRDQVTPEQFGAQAGDLQQRFPGVAMPVDAGGENVRGLLERVANTPGAGRTTVVPAILDRQAGQRERIGDALRDISGARAAVPSASRDLVPYDAAAAANAATGAARGRPSAYQAVQDAMAQRARAAQPLYEQAYREPVPYSFELESLLQTPAMRRAYRQAENRAANQQRPFYGQFARIADDGTVHIESVPSTGDLDIMKQSLDDQISALQRQGRNGEARDVQGIRSQLLALMDNASPTYAQARRAWAGPSQYMDAIENGRRMFSGNTSAEQLRAEFNALSPAEQEGYRIGAIDHILNKLDTVKGRAPDIANYLTSPAMRRKMDILLPDDQARAQWAGLLGFESEASALSRRALGNSATARRMAEMDDIDGDAVGALGKAATGQYLGLLFQALGKGAKAARDTIRARSDSAIADALTQPGGYQALRQRASTPTAPAPGNLVRAVTAGVTQANTERDPGWLGPKAGGRELLPVLRGRLAAGEPVDAADLVREYGVSRPAAGWALRQAQKELQTTAATYSSPLAANRAKRALPLPNDFAVAKVGDRQWQLQRAAE